MIGLDSSIRNALLANACVTGAAGKTGFSWLKKVTFLILRNHEFRGSSRRPFHALVKRLMLGNFALGGRFRKNLAQDCNSTLPSEEGDGKRQF